MAEGDEGGEGGKIHVYLLVALCTKGTGILPSECTDIVWHSHQ